MTLTDAVGDMADSEKKNIEYTQKNSIRLVFKLNPAITQGFRKQEVQFDDNKDAGIYVC